MGSRVPLPPSASPESDYETDSSSSHRRKFPHHLFLDPSIFFKPDDQRQGNQHNIGSLEVQFESEPLCKPRQPLRMDSLMPTPGHNELTTESCLAFKATRIHRYGRTFKANLSVQNRTLDVVLKFASGQKGGQGLLKEARLYTNELLPVQGRVVPDYIGLFGSTVTDSTVHSDGEGNETITCLVVTDVGIVPPRPVRELSAKQRYLKLINILLRTDFHVPRYVIFTALNAFHACGINHYDLHEGNIRLDPDERTAWFIDFERSEKHRCRHQLVCLGDEPPRREEFGCEELYDFGRVLRIWMHLGRYIRGSLI